MDYPTQSSSRPTPRPDPIAFICIVLFVWTAWSITAWDGAVSALSYLLTDSDYDGDPRIYGIIIQPFLTAIPGWFMFRRENFGRIFYLVVFTPVMVIRIAASFRPDSEVVFFMIISLLLLTASCLYLSTRSVIYYFTKDRSLLRKDGVEATGQRKKRERYEY